MNTESKDGGPAFPDDRSQVGMTLRQYYKAAALQGIMANADFLVSVRENAKGHSADIIIAANAGQLADAMLAEDEEHAKK